MENNPLYTLYYSLEDYFLSQSFLAIPTLQQFRKATSQGFITVIVSAPAPWPTLAELHLGVRIDLVETLAYQFTNGSAGYGKHSTTLITSSGNILGDPYQRYPVESERATPNAVQQMRDFMKQQGFAFLEKYSHVQALDALYNRHPEQKSPHLPNLFHRALRGVTLAKLAQRPGWSELVQVYRTALLARSTPPALMAQYDQLAHYLRTFSVN